MNMFRRTLAAFLCAALMTSGCASASGARAAQASAPTVPPAIEPGVLADYVQRLPAGSRVRVERTNGASLRGILLKATAASIVVQKNTRVPEPAVEVPLSDVTRVTLDPSSSSLGKHIAIGVGTGVAATFGVLLILAALWSD
jgi:hypothetical protein